MIIPFGFMKQASAATNDLISDMLLGLKFEDNLTDWTGNNIVTAFGSTSYPVGLVGKSRNFDGVNDYLQVPDTSPFDLQGDFTLLVIVNITSYNQNNPRWMFTKLQTSPSLDGWRFFHQNNASRTINFQVFNSVGGNTTVTSTTTTTSGTDYIVGVRSVGGNLDLWVEGVQESSSPLLADAGLNNQIPTIGAASWALTANEYDGTQDEISLYSRAFTDAEMVEAYNTLSSGTSIMV